MTATLRASSAFLVLLLFASCRDAVRPEPKDIVGLWVMEEECVPVLQKLGFTALTNRFDHMILLNENGTCAYRALDAPYPKRDFWEKCRFSDTEDNMLEDYPRGIIWYDWNGPCHVRLLNCTSCENGLKNFLHVEADDKGLYLWLPTYQNYDYYGPEQIKFRKSDSLPPSPR